MKQSIARQSQDDADLDEVSIALPRVTASEYEAICAWLEGMPRVRECRRG